MSAVGAILGSVDARQRSEKDQLVRVRVVSSAELRGSGLSREQVATLVRRGRLVRVGRGVYATHEMSESAAGTPSGDHLLLVAAALGGIKSGAAASHGSAVQLHGLEMLTEPGKPVTLTRAPGAGTRRARAGVRLHVAGLPARHVTVRYGLPVTTVARTVVDVARTAEFRDGVVVADSALRAGLVSKRELRQVLTACPRWPGLVRAAEVVEFADKLAESVLESIARVVFRDCKLPPPELQVWVGGDDVIGRADFFWRRYNTVAEVDGAMKYEDPMRARRQLRRDAALREAGFEVVHFDWWEITRAPDQVAASIRAAFARGGPRYDLAQAAARAAGQRLATG